jgi:hypothetical protein
MPTKAPKRRASDRAAAENLEPSDEEVQRAQKAVQDFIELIAKPAVELLTFDYTGEQWAQIERSLLHLQPGQAALERARNELVQAARIYMSELVDDALGRRTLEKWIAKEWARIKESSDDLLRSLTKVARFEGHDSPPGRQPAVELYKDEQPAVARLNAMAVARLAGLEIDDGFPKATRRRWFQFHVLHVWTELGGELQFSRHPTTGEIKGPLARYFVAATQPVCGGSLQSLRDILKRQKSMLAAVKQWAAKMREPNGDSTTV